MRTYLECYSCFFTQALRTARLIGLSEQKQKEIMKGVVRIVANLDTSEKPAEIGGQVYRLIRGKSGIHDPFKKIKEESNRMLLQFYPDMKKKANESKDPLQYAIKMAAGGNVIDYGIGEGNIRLDNIIAKIEQEQFGIFEYETFRKELEKAGTILFIGDNAGEIVFDRILIEELLPIVGRKNIIYSVRSVPVINDALIEDAEDVGITKLCRVISNGANTPGTILKLCSKKFLDIYETSDLIISKGQGNYEGLEGEPGNIYFLLKAKCQVVANHLGCSVGELILKKNCNANMPI